jgi:hypothetical protein
MKLSRLLLMCLLTILTINCTDPIEPRPADRVLVIVDVMTLNHWEYVPEGYTGISFSTCTEPFIPSVTGEFTTPSDVNIGIGGDTKFIWVKYMELPENSDMMVLVDIGVAHWSYWRPYHPPEWEPAGPLSTGTWGDCWRTGLIAKYLPLSASDNIVSTICLSITGSGYQNSCPDSILADEMYWPRETSPLDIHRGCGDDNFVFVSYYRPAIEHREATGEGMWER